MTDVVDSDELLRRIQRARAYAAQEARAGRARGGTGEPETGAGTDDAAPDAAVRTVAYEVVLQVLDEILRPGTHTEQR
ncbi:hypothetical protein [Streptomyces sp. NPDC057413]|uniref:hypothetical protein n=1 Tax=Streptomyces sp. NPDC057413 TaxID=3346124 RepID=UPI0036CC2E5D